MLVEENKAIIRRLFEEFVNNGNLNVADEVFASDFVDHGSPPERQGLAGVKESLTKFRAAFPDLHCTIESIIAEGDQVHVRTTIRGTHQGPYAGIQPSGQQITWTGMDDFRFADGKVVERWAERDRISQLGQMRAAHKAK